MKKPEEQTEIYESYEDYLKKKITPLDLFYIEDEELVFEIFSLGIKSRGILCQEDFNNTHIKKQIQEDPDSQEDNKEKIVYDINELFNIKGDFFYIINYHLHFCKENRISSILFIRYFNESKSEISSYIDLYSNNIITKIKQKKYIYASKKDLSFYNWKTNYICTNSSDNFEVIINKRVGIVFLHKQTNTYFTIRPSSEVKIKLSDNIYHAQNSKIHSSEQNKVISISEHVRKVEITDPQYLQCLLYTFFIPE